jgi:hypothetical protein
MGKQTREDQPDEVTGHAAHQVRLPGFLIDDEIGLGDAVKKITYRMAIKPCSGCEKRAAALNRWVSLSRR